MNRELTKRLHRDYMKVYRISELISNGIFLLLIIGYLIAALLLDWTLIPVWICLPLLAVSLIVFTWIVPKVKYARFRYELFEEELEIESGIIFISNVLVPMVRVQHVELGSGPLMRKYGLASVKVVTAATTHEISGLKREDAEALKRRIGVLAKVDDEDE
ncbi:PH domain-containing protein [Paenibacillus sp. J5C_2022]|uniref:PH domain-containing protein n=1 Tax=Paenibacillus sp. J5C2022 TaxID=2977129 RepID=UPI0021CF2A91|nr:PH domain-containing protein [Paenibacillus sp. J5C2022]MCU6712519.1 PH domain-containing protein [Paenibacillus sp. J5C2022]